MILAVTFAVNSVNIVIKRFLKARELRSTFFLMERIPSTHEDFEALIKEIQAKRKKIPITTTNNGINLGASGSFDREIYDSSGAKGKYEGYLTSIAVDDDLDEEDEDVRYLQKRTGYSRPVAFFEDIARSGQDFDPFADRRRPTVAQREDEYQQKWRRRVLSPDRVDPFAEALLEDKKTSQMSTHQGRGRRESIKYVQTESKKKRKEMFRKLARRDEKMKIEKEKKLGGNEKKAKKIHSKSIDKRRKHSRRTHS